MNTSVVVIGAGQSGLAMSRRLTERSIDHVVLERGGVANSWGTQRWDSLRLLTPRWQSRLPGSEPAAGDPDSFMTMPEVVSFIAGYADGISAPVHTGTAVTSVRATDTGYAVQTDQGTWKCASVVIASGGCNLANLPAVAAGAPDSIASITPLTYRSPDQVGDGRVLVVGASASGAQIADELARAGRQVTIATGECVRMPRSYRGKDIFWWMDVAGVLDERFDELDDLSRARHLPSPQLVGTPEHRTLDLNSLRENGVEVVGRLGMIRDGVALFSGGLANIFRLADLKLGRLLDRFDAWAQDAGLADLEATSRPEPTRLDAAPRLQLDLRRQGFETIVWATGYRPDYSWLDVPVVDRKGHLRHDGGVVTDAPGLYVLGTSVLRRRRSTYISGAGQDSLDIAEQLANHLAGRPTLPAKPAPYDICSQLRQPSGALTATPSDQPSPSRAERRPASAHRT
ncbi:NAD(P)/FAD-dependent oxidoreductase [Parafrigoribacterium mesophilum]|uniref:flavin-containing monooxygenase n=1 Tax=Parafrigoribacterium mesophilum TaxID=433646 RepID=UPI0031FC495B